MECLNKVAVGLVSVLNDRTWEGGVNKCERGGEGVHFRCIFFRRVLTLFALIAHSASHNYTVLTNLRQNFLVLHLRREGAGIGVPSEYGSGGCYYTKLEQLT